jgi:hypothetical protein
MGNKIIDVALFAGHKKLGEYKEILVESILLNLLSIAKYLIKFEGHNFVAVFRFIYKTWSGEDWI